MRNVAIVIATLGLTLGACGKKDTPPPTTPGDPSVVAPTDPTDPTDPAAPTDPATPTDPVVADPTDAPSVDRVALLRAGLEAYNTGRLEDAFATFTDDTTRNTVGDPMMPVIRGRDANIAGERAFVAAFPDARIDLVRVFESGDWLIAEVVFAGTHNGPFQGLEPTGKRYGAPGAIAFHYTKENKVDRFDVFGDSAVMMMQLGAFPSPTGEVPAVASAPVGEPEIIRGEANAENMAVLTSFFEAFTPDNRVAAWEKFIAEDFVWSVPARGQRIEGRQANLEYMNEHVFPMIPDWTARTELAMGAGDNVIAWAVNTGTHTSADEGSEPTTRKITTHSLLIAKVADGKIGSMTMYANGMEMMAQLGLLGGAGARNPDADGATIDEVFERELDAAREELDEAMKDLDKTVKEAMDELGKAMDDAGDELKGAADELEEATEELKAQDDADDETP